MMKKQLSALILAGVGIFWVYTPVDAQSHLTGSYLNEHRVQVYDPGEQAWTSYTVTDILVLKLHANQRLNFCFELYFANGHRCVMDGIAQRIDEGRYEFQELDSETGGVKCQLRIQMKSDVIRLSDIDAMCRDYYCGARGFIDEAAFRYASKVQQDVDCGIRN